MDFARLKLNHVEFPGRAGEYQRQGRTTALVRELGENYDHYHDFLATEMERLPVPTAERFPGADEYLTAWAYLQELVIAEIILRNTRAHLERGRRLDQPPDGSTPLVRDSRLVRESRAPQR
jgi:hypothetical protein